jgi:hypothetical protein
MVWFVGLVWMVGSLPHGLDKAHIEQHGTIERLWSHLAIKKYTHYSE